MKSETFNRKKKINAAKSVEAKEREITPEEQLNMIFTEYSHVNNTPSRKSNHPETGKKSLERNNGANHAS